MSRRAALLTIACVLGTVALLPAQPLPPVIPPGWVLVDDMILPDPTGPDSNYTAVAWPNGIVPYSVHASITPQNEALLLAAMAEIEAIANVDFVPRVSQS